MKLNGLKPKSHKRHKLTQAPDKTGGPNKFWPHCQLYHDVIKTLFALPEEFHSSLQIADFRATDIFSLNTALGASIEDSVVTGLNSLREVWDPSGKYSLYRFERQSQAFPDVRLTTDAPGHQPILLGIELKGWFALSKEGEPTFRYKVTPNACADADLLVVYPWVLSDVIAGKPKLLKPFVDEAKYAAELRNYYWRTRRGAAGGNGGIIIASHQSPYPNSKVDPCSDRAEEDSSNNFGRVARYGLMDDFVKATHKKEISGIPVGAWLKFFKIFKDSSDGLDKMLAEIESGFRGLVPKEKETRENLVAAVGQILATLKTQI
jgi:hypothetical protein